MKEPIKEIGKMAVIYLIGVPISIIGVCIGLVTWSKLIEKFPWLGAD